MTAFAKRVQRNPYFLLGTAAAILAFLALQFGLNNSVTLYIPKLPWQMVTGLLLVGLLAFQWGLFFHKQNKNLAAIPRNRELHKYAGIAFVVIFALHAESVGYAWMLILTLILGGLIATGLLNREIVRYRNQWSYKTWLWLHVALAAMLTPFVIMHALVALLFE